ncbi:transcriptional regulator [Ensifer sp. MJa1]|uniref:transcriptional regulator n=1 Tax=Ensifer sp. MJa1 TaxID=2919888 RepID=UPI003FA5D773
MPNSAALDDILLALANPVRRRIFEILFGGEVRVADMATAVAVRGEELEKHLALLDTAGLITRLRRRDGESLSGSPAPLNEAATWINTNRELWAMRTEMPETLLASGAPEPVLTRTPIRDRDSEPKSRRPRPMGPRRDN